MSFRLTTALALVMSMPVTALAQAPAPPIAAKKPFLMKGPEGVPPRNDEYYWLRDDTRKNPEMLADLNAENAYADAVLAPTKPLQDTLYDEIVGRINRMTRASPTASAVTGITPVSKPARITRSTRAARAA